MPNIRHFRELEVYRLAIKTSVQIFELSKHFPREEQYSLIDQIRRSSRSVCANLAEAWRKRRYRNAFVSKLSDAEAEAAETQVWLEIAFLSKYIDERIFQELDGIYEHILGMLVKRIDRPDQWTIRAAPNKK
jgi:four helix bundle protein